MATKTISIDLEAYQRLKIARLEARESFSQVIKRAIWKDQPKTCQSLLAALFEMPGADDAVIERLEQAQQSDPTPDNPWE